MQSESLLPSHHQNEAARFLKCRSVKSWELNLMTLVRIFPSSWSWAQVLGIPARQFVLFSPLRVCDLTYLSTLLPQGNLYLCGAGTSCKAQTMTEIKPSLFSRQRLSLQSAIVSVSAGVTALIMRLTHSGRKVADTDRNSLNIISMWLDQWV